MATPTLVELAAMSDGVLADRLEECSHDELAEVLARLVILLRGTHLPGPAGPWPHVPGAGIWDTDLLAGADWPLRRPVST